MIYGHHLEETHTKDGSWENIHGIKKNIGPYAVSFYYGDHGQCVGSQTTTLTLHNESLACKWDIVLILKFITLVMILGARDVTQYQNLGY